MTVVLMIVPTMTPATPIYTGPPTMQHINRDMFLATLQPMYFSSLDGEGYTYCRQLPLDFQNPCKTWQPWH
eukprot:8812526-Pyramimonas_sp.AAC.1